MSLKSYARQILERVLDFYGYALKEKDAPVREPREFLAMMARGGFAAKTVIDVGVGDGTPWLYEAFPSAHLVLVEANDDYRPALVEICRRHGGEYHILAAGAQSSTETLYVNRNFATSSGLAQLSEAYVRKLENNAIYRDLDPRKVSVRPLDSLLNEKMRAPFLLKLDVEGYESQVLDGAAQVLAHTEMIITEMSVLRRYRSEPRFAEFIANLDSLGFEFFDVVGLCQTTRDVPLTYMDAVFVRRDSAPRGI